MYKMAAASGAFGVHGGFNQSAGGYYLVISTVQNQVMTYTPGAGGSGGAFLPGSFAANGMAGNYSTVFAAGKVIKDMGKTVVSAGRSFRKFQAVVNTASGSSSFGVAGNVPGASADTTGYFTGYLELNRDGSNAGAAPGIPQIARFA
jgi:hypothetical protein